MTNKTKIITDSCSDFPKELIKSLDVSIIPINIIINDKSYTDGKDISAKELLEYAREKKNKITTSAVSVADVIDEFKKYLDYENIIMITMSSKGSSCFQTCNLAKQHLENELQRPLNIHIIDSNSYSCYESMVVCGAAKLAKDNAGITEIIDKIEYIKSNNNGIFLIDKLDGLKRGGRLNQGVALIGGLMNIKPLVNVQDGLVTQVSKERGIAKSMPVMLNIVSKNLNGRQIKQAWFAHTEAIDNVEKYKLQFIERFSPNETFICTCGCTLAAHVEEGFFGASYFW